MHNIHIAAKALLLSVVAAAVGILIAAMLTFAANNASIALAQADAPPASESDKPVIPNTGMTALLRRLLFFKARFDTAQCSHPFGHY